MAMNITKMKTAMTIAHKAQDHVHVIGRHGIGKSEIVSQWARENDYHIEILQLPILEVSDLVGMPIVVESKYGQETKWAAPGWIQRVNEANSNGKHCVIFLDELGRASVDIRQAALQLVLEGRVNEHSIGELNGMKSLCVVADNPSDEYDTADFDMALEDRFQSYDVQPSIEEFLKYAKEVEMEEVVTDFLAEYQEKLHFTPETDGEKGSSPRAWKKLSDALKVNTDQDFLYSLILSKVGKTVGNSFHHFYNNYIKVVKPEDILAAIGKSKMVTEKDQRATAKKLSKITKAIEVISATELANKMRILSQKDDSKVTPQHVAVYLASLNLEVTAGVLKGWKNSEDTTESEYYYKDIQNSTPDRWLLKELISKVASK